MTLKITCTSIHYSYNIIMMGEPKNISIAQASLHLHTRYMVKFSKSIQAWNSDSFNIVLVSEICSLPAKELQLQQGMAHGSFALDDDISATILRLENDDANIFVRAGLFYKSIIAGCNCADDPSPVDKIDEYCEVLIRINRQTGNATVSLLSG